MSQGDFSEVLDPAVSGLGGPIVIHDVATGNPFSGNVIPKGQINPVEVHGRQSNFNLTTGAIDVAGGGDPLVRNDDRDFAPRFGFAYDVTGKGKTVVRGGYGVFYFLDRGGISNQLAQNPPFSGSSQYNFSDGDRITLSGEGPMGAGTTGGLNPILSTGPCRSATATA